MKCGFVSKKKYPPLSPPLTLQFTYGLEILETCIVILSGLSNSSTYSSPMLRFCVLAFLLGRPASFLKLFFTCIPRLVIRSLFTFFISGNISIVNEPRSICTKRAPDAGSCIPTNLGGAMYISLELSATDISIG